MNGNGFKWFHVVTALFVTTLIVSNIIAVKLISVWSLVLPAAVILFPIAYIIGDVLTEVYGFARARQVIWTGFFCNLIAVLAIWITGRLAPAPFWALGLFDSPQAAQQAYDAILGFAPRLLLASFLAYLVGEFLNSIILAKLKVRTEGRYLWVRTIGQPSWDRELILWSSSPSLSGGCFLLTRLARPSCLNGCSKSHSKPWRHPSHIGW